MVNYDNLFSIVIRQPNQDFVKLYYSNFVRFNYPYSTTLYTRQTFIKLKFIKDSKTCKELTVLC